MIKWIGSVGAIGRVLVASLVSVVAYLFYLQSHFQFGIAFLSAWNIWGLTNLLLAWGVIGSATAEQTRASVCEQDQSSVSILLLVIAVSLVGPIAVTFMLQGAKDLLLWSKALHFGLSLGALLVAWLLVNTRFAFHYAHLYYRADKPEEGKHGLHFPGGRAPDYLDFAYYSFVIGMASQVSDVSITSHHIRRLTLFHGMFSFAFNMLVLALSVNIFASGL